MAYKKVSGVYKITCFKNNRIYIGSSITLTERFKRHKDSLNGGTHVNYHLQRAWNKYGEDQFKFEIIEYCNKEDCIKREQYYLDNLLFAQEYIRKENKKFLNLGFNINPTAGNSLGRKYRPETIQKIIALRTGTKFSSTAKLNMQTAQLRPEVVERKSRVMKEKCSTEEARKGLSDRAKKLWQNEDYRNKVITNATKGVQTEEYRKKRSIMSKEMFLNNPTLSTKLAEIQRELNNDENHKKKVLEGLKNSMTDEVISQRKKSLKERWAKKKSDENYKYKREIVGYDLNNNEVIRYPTITNCFRAIRVSYKTLIKYMGEGKRIDNILYKQI